MGKYMKYGLRAGQGYAGGFVPGWTAEGQEEMLRSADARIAALQAPRFESKLEPSQTVARSDPLREFDERLAGLNAYANLSNTERYQLAGSSGRARNRLGSIAPGSAAEVSEMRRQAVILGTDRDTLRKELGMRRGGVLRPCDGSPNARGLRSGGVVGVRGPGSGTSDDIPLRVEDARGKGLRVKVSNGEALAVLPARTAKNPQAVEAVNAIIERTNGQAPRRGLREGMGYQTGGVWNPIAAYEDEQRALQNARRAQNATANNAQAIAAQQDENDALRRPGLSSQPVYHGKVIGGTSSPPRPLPTKPLKLGSDLVAVASAPYNDEVRTLRNSTRVVPANLENLEGIRPPTAGIPTNYSKEDAGRLLAGHLDPSGFLGSDKDMVRKLGEGHSTIAPTGGAGGNSPIVPLAATQPGATQPGATQPSATQPGATSAATQPGATQPGATLDPWDEIRARNKLADIKLREAQAAAGEEGRYRDNLGQPKGWMDALLNNTNGTRNKFNEAQETLGTGIIMSTAPSREGGRHVLLTDGGTRKPQYVDTDGKYTDDWTKTRQYKDSVARLERSKQLSDEMERDRIKRSVESRNPAYQQEGLRMQAIRSAQAQEDAFRAQAEARGRGLNAGQPTVAEQYSMFQKDRDFAANELHRRAESARQKRSDARDILDRQNKDNPERGAQLTSILSAMDQDAVDNSTPEMLAAQATDHLAVVDVFKSLGARVGVNGVGYPGTKLTLEETSKPGFAKEVLSGNFRITGNGAWLVDVTTGIGVPIAEFYSKLTPEQQLIVEKVMMKKKKQAEKKEG
jgi:hypothetical protein